MSIEAPHYMKKQEQPFFFVYSFNHHAVELDLREKLKLPERVKEVLRQRLSELDVLEEYLILDTCNRWELYGVVGVDEDREKVLEIVKDCFPLSAKHLDRIVCSFKVSRAIQHLFEVSAGVDSQMVGETEIFGQVKAAFATATENKTIGSYLNKIFSKAFQSAKWVRTHTSIGRGTVSIGNVSVDLAQRIFGELSDRKVLLVGSGEVGRLTAQALKNRSIQSISFTSRTLENAKKLRDEIGGTVLDYSTLDAHLHEFDIVITSTSAPNYIFERKAVKKMMGKRSYNPFFLIDLAMPRDVEPTVGKVSQVFLYNLDDVSKIANENLDYRSQEIEQCRKVLSGKSWSVWLEMGRRYQMRSFRNKDEAG